MVQCMKPEPASPDQRVPSQSKTAMVGERSRTDWWNSAGVRDVWEDLWHGAARLFCAGSSRAVTVR